MEDKWETKVNVWMKKYQIEKVSLNLIYEALTHSSYKGMGYVVKDNERLEFLGDSVLDLIVAHQLFLNSQLSEGKMTEERKSMVQNEKLAHLFDKIGLEELTRTANDFDFSLKSKADFIEALFGAIFLDKGYLRSFEFWEIIQELNKGNELRSSINEINERESIKEEDLSKNGKSEISKNAKNVLQEYCQKLGLPLPQYRLIKKEGLDHQPLFTVGVIVEALIEGKKETLDASAISPTIKKSEILSAEKICDQLKLDYKTV